MDILFILMVAFGITFGLQHKVSFLWGKSDFLDRMLGCAYCTGFHAGWMAWLLFIGTEAYLDADVLLDLSPFDPIMVAFASSGFSYLADTASRWLESNSDPLEG